MKILSLLLRWLSPYESHQTLCQSHHLCNLRFHLPGGTGPRPPTPSSCHSQHWSRHGEHSRWKSSNKSFKWLWLYNISHLAMNSVSKNTFAGWILSLYNLKWQTVCLKRYYIYPSNYHAGLRGYRKWCWNAMMNKENTFS